MSKRPVNLTLDERVLTFAEAVMELRGQSSLSGFIEELIRVEYERRAGPLILHGTPPPYRAAAAPKPNAANERKQFK
jgi:hypothetical protein